MLSIVHILLGIGLACFLVLLIIVLRVVVWGYKNIAAMQSAAKHFPSLPNGVGKKMFSEYREAAHGMYQEQLGGPYTFSFDGIVCTTNNTLIAKLCRLQAHSIGRSWLYTGISAVMPGSYGILFAEKDEWRRRHLAFTPVFSPPNLRHYNKCMLDCVLVEMHATARKLSILRAAQQRFVADPGSAAAICAAATAELRDFVAVLHTQNIDNLADYELQTRIVVDPLWPSKLRIAGCDNGPHPTDDLLCAVRWMAVRVLFSWGFGLSASGAEHSAARNADLQAAVAQNTRTVVVPLARAVDAYARIWLEQMPHCSGAIDWLSRYAKLWRIKRSIKAILAADSKRKKQQPTTAIAQLTALHADNRNAVREAVVAVDKTENAAKTATTTATTTDHSAPLTFLEAMKKANFTLDEMACEANHVNGAHKAVAFTSVACLFELSKPSNEKWRQAVKQEFIDVCGVPPSSADASRDLQTHMAGFAALLRQSWCGNAGWRGPERSDWENDRFPVTTRVWKETLRLHVVSLGTVRVFLFCSTGEPITDPESGIEIPAGSDVQLLLHRLHTHPDYWPQPLSFEPDRWTPGSPLQGKRECFFPFLDGQRRCAGMYLAEVQFLVILYVCLVLFDVRVDGSAASPTDFDVDAMLRHTEGPRHSAVVPDGEGDFKLRMRADMFSAFDGRIPFTAKPTWCDETSK